MSDNPFDNIDEYITPVPQQHPTVKRKASPAAQQAASKRRKPTPDRYRTADVPQGQPAYQTQPSVPSTKKKQKKSKKNTMSAEAMMQQKAKEKPTSNASILSRIVFFFRTNSPIEIWMSFLSWVSRHPYVIFLMAVVFIAVGMLFSRYISVVGSVLFIALGALLSREDFDTAGYCCYGAAFMDFIIPYLI